MHSGSEEQRAYDTRQRVIGSLLVMLALLLLILWGNVAGIILLGVLAFGLSRVVLGDVTMRDRVLPLAARIPLTLAAVLVMLLR